MLSGTGGIDAQGGSDSRLPYAGAWAEDDFDSPHTPRRTMISNKPSLMHQTPAYALEAHR